MVRAALILQSDMVFCPHNHEGVEDETHGICNRGGACRGRSGGRQRCADRKSYLDNDADARAAGSVRAMLASGRAVCDTGSRLVLLATGARAGIRRQQWCHTLLERRGARLLLPGIRCLLIVAGAIAALGQSATASENRRDGAYWDWQLTNPYDLSVRVEILVIEPTGVTAADVAALKARGVQPFCYVSIGTWEPWRDDAESFPASVIGATVGDWPDEKYVDMADRAHVWPLMKARIDVCAAMGFVGVEPDNMGAHDNDTGFPFTSADAVVYFREIAAHTHGLGLKILQKNADELVPQLVDTFDGMLVEECFHYDFCEEVLPYVRAGKPVLAVEFTENGGDWDAYCAQAKAYGFHLLLKSYEVTAGGRACQ